MGRLTTRRAGDTRARTTRNRGIADERHAFRKDRETETETVDSNLAAVSEVEAGIRDFVRNDIAYLRRPAVTATSDAPPLDPAPKPP